MPTLHDIARMAGVSVATVSHVINDTRYVSPGTRQRVELVIARIGFVPDQNARTLAQRRGARGLTPSAATREVAGWGAFPAPAGGAAVAGALHPEGLWGRPVVQTAATGLNKNSALRALRVVRAAQPISRADLARRLEVHRSTITEIVNPLLAAGVLREEESAPDGTRRNGRPATRISFHGGRTFLIGVSVGVRTTQIGASTPDGRPLGEATFFDTPSQPDRALALIRSTVEQLRAALPDRALGCIGVSVPGMTDADRSRLLFAPHLGWREVAVADALRCVGPKPFGGNEDQRVRVIVENDASAAALYEIRRRLRDCPGEEAGHFALVRVGTGIGVGLVLGGEVFRGAGAAGGMAGEFGHMTIVAGGKPCVCGNRGCWERYAAEPGAVALYTGERTAAPGSPPVEFAEIVARAQAGERRARATLERVGEYLGIGISNVVMGLGVARVVVSGRIFDAWQFVKGPLDEAVGRTLAGQLTGRSVEPSGPEGAGLGGALEVAAEHYLTTLLTQKRAAA